ncbi:hypothetical protein AB0K12_40235 [Nonomuraea sp. NPDC049419]
MLLPAATALTILLGSAAKLVTRRREVAATLGSQLILGGGVASAFLLVTR